MNRIRISTALFVAVLGITATSPNVSADEWNKKTTVTTTGPMEVPGATLPAGKYVFKLMDSASDRHIVTVKNERENKTFATILAINNYRLQPTGKSLFTFYETPAGQPVALRAWFYPGDNFGQEFVYSKNRATQLAQVTTTQQEARTEPAPAAEAPPPAPAPPEPTVAQNTPPPAPTAAPPPPEPAPAPSEPQTVVRNENPAPKTLPETASNVPLLALFGFLSIGAAVGLTGFNRSRSAYSKSHSE